MAVHNFGDLREHIAHPVVVVGYGNPLVNVSVECELCDEVLVDFDREDDDEE
jgi:hypothetical protein